MTFGARRFHTFQSRAITCSFELESQTNLSILRWSQRTLVWSFSLIGLFSSALVFNSLCFMVYFSVFILQCFIFQISFSFRKLEVFQMESNFSKISFITSKAVRIESQYLFLRKSVEQKTVPYGIKGQCKFRCSINDQDCRICLTTWWTSTHQEFLIVW